jgi:hypothetical protein
MLKAIGPTTVYDTTGYLILCHTRYGLQYLDGELFVAFGKEYSSDGKTIHIYLDQMIAVKNVFIIELSDQEKISILEKIENGLKFLGFKVQK